MALLWPTNWRFGSCWSFLMMTLLNMCDLKVKFAHPWMRVTNLQPLLSLPDLMLLMNYSDMFFLRTSGGFRAAPATELQGKLSTSAGHRPWESNHNFMTIPLIVVRSILIKKMRHVLFPSVYPIESKLLMVKQNIFNCSMVSKKVTISYLSIKS